MAKASPGGQGGGLVVAGRDGELKAAVAESVSRDAEPRPGQVAGGVDDALQQSLAGGRRQDLFGHVDEAVHPLQVPARREPSALLQGDVLQRKDEATQAAVIVHVGRQRPVPVGDPQLGLIRKDERLGAKHGGLARVAHALEYRLVLGIGKEVKVVPPQEFVERVPAARHVHRIGVQKVELEVQVCQRRVHVLGDRQELVVVHTTGGRDAFGCLQFANQRGEMLPGCFVPVLVRFAAGGLQFADQPADRADGVVPLCVGHGYQGSLVGR